MRDHQSIITIQGGKQEIKNEKFGETDEERGKFLSKLTELLKPCQPTTSLRLENNNLGDTGVMSMALNDVPLTTLTSLSLVNNNIGPRGARSLALTLGDKNKSPPVKMLDLSNNQLCGMKGDVGTYTTDGLRALLDALKTKGMIIDLNLALNDIGLEGVQLLAQTFDSKSTLRFLTLKDDFGDDAAKALAPMIQFLEKMIVMSTNLTGITGVGAKALATAIGSSKSLTHLFLHRRKPYVELASADDSLCDAILKSKSIQVFNDVPIQNLRNGEESNLKLSTHTLTADGGMVLARVLKTYNHISSLKSLSLKLVGSGYIGKLSIVQIIEPLKKADSLESLDLFSNPEFGKKWEPRLSLEVAKAIANILSEEKRSRVIWPLSRASKPSKLKSLRIHNCYISDEFVAALAEGLTTNTSLETLDLGYNLIEEAGVKALADALTVNGNSSLKTIHLNANNFREFSPSKKELNRILGQPSLDFVSPQRPVVAAAPSSNNPPHL